MEKNDIEEMRSVLEAAKYCLKNRWICSGYTIEETVDKIDIALDKLTQRLQFVDEGEIQ